MRRGTSRSLAIRKLSSPLSCPLWWYKKSNLTISPKGSTSFSRTYSGAVESILPIHNLRESNGSLSSRLVPSSSSGRGRGVLGVAVPLSSINSIAHHTCLCAIVLFIPYLWNLIRCSGLFVKKLSSQGGHVELRFVFATQHFLNTKGSMTYHTLNTYNSLWFTPFNRLI